MPQTAGQKPVLNLTVISNGADRQQNESGELIFYVGSELEVKCEAERSETRRLFWDAACRELDSGHEVACSESLGFSPAEVLIYLIIFILNECNSVLAIDESLVLSI